MKANLLGFLSGKKTYIIGLAGVLYAAGIHYWHWPNEQEIWGALGFTSVMTMRSAIAKLCRDLFAALPENPAATPRIPINRVLSILLACILLPSSFFLLPACTPSQAIANGNYIAGAQLATYVLGQHPDAVPALQHLSDVLPDIVRGKVPPREMGQLNAQLEPIFQAAGAAYPNDRSVFVHIGSLLSAGSKINGANPTAYQGIALAAVIDVQNGISDSIQFNAGRHDITDPPDVQIATKKASKHL